jgi:hypothetical protein
MQAEFLYEELKSIEEAANRKVEWRILLCVSRRWEVSENGEKVCVAQKRGQRWAFVKTAR